MALGERTQGLIPQTSTLRRWFSRAFIVSILAYLVVVGYLVAEAVTGASKWAPYGVNVPAFITLVIASEVIITLTAVWIFKEDSGIWPDAIAQGWARARAGAVLGGLRQVAVGAWDIPIIELRLRTSRAIMLGRINRIAALVPLAYVLLASAGGAPWGLRTGALVDVAITMAVWAFMEAVMVQPQSASATPAVPRAARKVSRYELRPVRTDDLDRILELEGLKWKEQAATREKVLSRLEVFPEGQIGAVHVTEVDGLPVRESVVAWITVMLADEEQLQAFGTWEEVTASGTIGNNKAGGNSIVGVNLTSVTNGAIYMLIGHILSLVLAWGKRKMIGGVRLNGFVAFNRRRSQEGKRPLMADEYARLREVRGYRLNEERLGSAMTPLADDDYLRQVAALRLERGEPPLAGDERPDYVCSNLREYLSIPGGRLLSVIPNYFPDAASDNYGVLVDWPNPIPRPLRYVPFVKAAAAAWVRRAVRSEWEERKRKVHERARGRTAAQVPGYLRRDGATGGLDEGAVTATVLVPEREPTRQE